MLSYHGFGYDHVNDKYKVLVVVKNKDNLSETLTKIYTFGEDSWKIIQNFPRSFATNLRGKFVSGTLNWIVNKKEGCSKQRVILSFDLAKETFMEVLLPPKDGNDICTSRRLCVSNNCLYVCEFYISGDFRWVYWLMKEYGVVESWTKLMIISNSGLLNPLFISENGCVLVDGFTSKLIRYNLYSGEFDYPCILRSSFLRLNQHIYCESLVSL
jgi:F-box interacting protein